MRTFNVGLTHLASLIFSAAILISQPQFATLVIFIAGFNLAFALASVLSLGHFYLNGKLAELSESFSSLIGTHCGGMLCYAVTINYAIHIKP